MTLRTRLTGLAAALTVVGIVVALPVTLLAVGANPLPDVWPTLDQVRTALTSPDDGTLALGAIKVIAWAAWLFLAGAIALEILSRARGVRAPQLRGLGMPQAAARGLVGTALLLFAAAPMSGTPPNAAPTAQASSVATVMAFPDQASAPVQATEASGHASARPHHAPAASATLEHVVERGDTLWSIAERHLGAGSRYTELADLNRAVLGPDPGFLPVGVVLQIPDAPRQDTAHGEHPETVERGDTLSQIAQEELGDADRYPEIFEASRDTVQPGGRHLSDPDLILPGWTLTIPASEAPRVTPPSPAHEPVAPAPPPPASTEAPSPAPAVPAAPPATPAQSSSNDAPATNDTAAADTQDTEDSQAPWLLTGLTGGGAMLAGAMLLALRSRRRAQFRARRPGRTIAAPEPLLAPVEKTLTVVGVPACIDVELMDEALHRLAAAITVTGGLIPELAAVELSQHALNLHLSAPSRLDDPWSGSDDQLHWTLPAGADLADVGPQIPDHPAPYPLLVTIGAGDNGNVWLLNIEDLALSITGDATFGRDFARYLAAEIACNPWSHGVRVDLVGVGHEVAPMNTDRIRVHAGGSGDPAAEVLADAIDTIDRSAESGVDVATARARQDGPESWPARILLVDAADSEADVDASGTAPALDQLLDLVYQHAGQTGASVVLRGERAGAPGRRAARHRQRQGHPPARRPRPDRRRPDQRRGPRVRRPAGAKRGPRRRAHAGRRARARGMAGLVRRGRSIA